MKTKEVIRKKIKALTSALPDYTTAASEAKVSAHRIELLSAVAALRWVIEEAPPSNSVYRIISELEKEDLGATE